MERHLHSHAHRHVNKHGHRLGARVPTRPKEEQLSAVARGSAAERNLAPETPPSHLTSRADCKPGDTSSLCEKPVGGTTLTIPIVVGVVVVVLGVLGVLVYLHRRAKKRQAKEDQDDKYKSVDFGMAEAKTSKRKSKLFGGEKDAGHSKGLSMDMNLSSPYLLPAGMQQSRESLHSLARTLQHNDDPYRHVDSFVSASDGTSMRSFPKGPNTRSSTLTGTTTYSDGRSTPKIQTSNLPPRQKSIPTAPLPQIPNPAKSPLHMEVQEISTPQSAPPTKSEFRFTDEPLPIQNDNGHVNMPLMPEIQMPAPSAQKLGSSSARPTSYESIKADQSYVGGLVGDRDSAALPASDPYHNRSVGGGFGLMDTHAIAADDTVPNNVRPGRKDSAPVISQVPSEYDDYASYAQLGYNEQEQYGDDQRGRQMGYGANVAEPHSEGLGVPHSENKRLSVGFRPLPPAELLESEDPEFRANRIRSFYKEYFDDGSDPRPPMPQPQAAQYYEDYDSGYLGDAAYFDPDSNAFVMPYAQPVTRRAMTPPPNNRRQMPGPRPRGPPGPRGMGPPGPRSRAGSTYSGGRFGPGTPRPGSSASARMGKPGPKKALPPPAALNTLPTPSKLKDDSFALMNAIDFAPPTTFKDQTTGRSPSPLGERRPYAMNVPVSSPLVSSFEETPALPSPHLLRRSGTFTALDFAPPRRFKDADTMSDAGSVRSMGSGISARTNNAIRNGAGRVSRLPGDQVFTNAAMGNQLKPKWGMRD